MGYIAQIGLAILPCAHKHCQNAALNVIEQLDCQIFAVQPDNSDADDDDDDDDGAVHPAFIQRID